MYAFSRHIYSLSVCAFYTNAMAFTLFSEHRSLAVLLSRFPLRPVYTHTYKIVLGERERETKSINIIKKSDKLLLIYM
jgi:hypothetical protein